MGWLLLPWITCPRLWKTLTFAIFFIAKIIRARTILHDFFHRYRIFI